MLRSDESLSRLIFYHLVLHSYPWLSLSGPSTYAASRCLTLIFYVRYDTKYFSSAICRRPYTCGVLQSDVTVLFRCTCKYSTKNRPLTATIQLEHYGHYHDLAYCQESFGAAPKNMAELTNHVTKVLHSCTFQKEIHSVHDVMFIYSSKIIRVIFRLPKFTLATLLNIDDWVVDSPSLLLCTRDSSTVCYSLYICFCHLHFELSKFTKGKNR